MNSRQFLVRPLPQPIELLDGYVLRLLRANGFSDRRAVFQYSDSYRFLMEHLSADWDQHVTMFDKSKHSLEKLSGLAQQRVFTPHIRWCWRCLEESQHWRGEWILRTSVICVHHKCRLEDRCVNCVSTAVVSAHPEKCHCCGTARRSASTQKIAENLLRFQRFLYNWRETAPEQKRLFGLDFYQAAKLIFYLGQFDLGVVPAKMRFRVEDRTVENDYLILKRAVKAISNWPRGFTQLVRSIQPESTTNSLKKDFRSFYFVLYRSLKEPCYQFVRDVFEKYINSCWAGVISARNTSFSKSARQSHPRQTLAVVAKAAGIENATVSHLAKANLVPHNVVNFPTGRRSLSVDKNVLSSLESSQKDRLTLNEAALLLKIPRRRLRILLDNGVVKARLSPVIHQTASWHISKLEISLLLITPTQRSTSKSVSLNHILRYSRLTDHEFVGLVNSLIDGVLGSVGIDRRISLGEVVLEKQGFQTWLHKFRSINTGTVSIDEAARKLGIKQQVAYELVRSGLLETVSCKADSRRVALEALNKFQSEYVALAELARVNKCSPRAMKRFLSCCPVTGPEVDNNRQYFYRRSDLVNFVAL